MSTSPPTTPPSPVIGTRGPGGRTQPPVPGRGATPPPALVPGARRQRRWSLALLAVLITLGSALGFVVLWMNAGGRKPVLVMSNDVQAGQIIQEDDLRVVRIAADPGVRLLSSSSLDAVVGKPAAVDLLEGQALTKTSIGENDGLQGDDALLAIPVPVERLVDDLQAGDTITIFRAPEGEESEPETIGQGRVYKVGDEDDSGSDVRVTVNVDVALAPEITAAIDADKIYLARTARQGG